MSKGKRTNTSKKARLESALITTFFRILMVLVGVCFIITGSAMEGNELARKVVTLGWMSILLLLSIKIIHHVGFKNFVEKVQLTAYHIKDKLDGIGEGTLAVSELVNKNESPLAPGLPPLSILPAPPVAVQKAEQERTGKGFANRVNAAFRRCGLLRQGDTLEIVNIQTGPGSVRITVKLEEIKITQVTAMSENLANSFGVTSIQVEDGAWANTAALIIPFTNRLPVYLKTILQTEEFAAFYKKAELPIVLGCNDTWQPILLDLVAVKHLLIGGATGSGKSYCLNTMITTLLMCVPPERLQLFFIDPKMVELTPYKGFPHTVTVAITTEEALQILDKLTKEMDRRYEVFTQHKVKNIQHYWKKTGDKSMKYVVVVIDELADLMLVSKNQKKSEEAVEVMGAEYSIQRLTQKARAAGIHLIVATQRPDVKVVTGTIKSNLPSRISFYLLSQHDYRTILDEVPPFELMGKGDGLAIIEGQRGRIRFQGACVALTDDQIEKTIIELEKFWVKQDKKEKTIKEENKNLLPTSNDGAGNRFLLEDYIKKLERLQPAQPGNLIADVDNQNELKTSEINTTKIQANPSVPSGPTVKCGNRVEKTNLGNEMVLLPDLLATSRKEKINEKDTVAVAQNAPITEDTKEMKQLKRLIAKSWLDQVNNGIPADKIKAPSIRKARSVLKIKQDTVMELYNRLVEENWLQQPSAPRQPFIIVADEEVLKNEME